jgi:hypothetical protein
VAVLMGAMIVLALAGAHLQDGKKAAALGPRLGGMERADLVLAAAGRLAKITPLQWAIGTVLWLGATYGHIHANHVLAGIWRWLADY